MNAGQSHSGFGRLPKIKGSTMSLSFTDYFIFCFVHVGQAIGIDGLLPHFQARNRFGLLSDSKMGYFADLPVPEKDTFPELLKNADLNQS